MLALHVLTAARFVFSRQNSNAYLCIKTKDMALSIPTSIPSVCFSSAFPQVQISSTYAEVTVKLKINANVIHTAVLYPYNGTVWLSYARDIIEEWLSENELPSCSVQVTAEASGGSVTASSTSATVIYCVMGMPVSAATFTSKRFLTTLPSRKLSRKGCGICLYYYGSGSASLKLTVLKTSGSRATVTSSISSSGTGMHSIILSMDSIMSKAGTGVAKVLAATVTAGDRTASFFFTDQVPDLVFSFSNAFGCPEYLELIGTTATVDEVTQETAVLERSLVQYDRSVTRSYKTRCSGLTKEMAELILQLASSSLVALVDQTLDDEEDYPHVLIENVEGEPSDTDDGLQEATVTWRLADRRTGLFATGLADPARIFTAEYDGSFT